MRDFTVTVTENKQIAENIRSLTFRLPEKIDVRAGQFAEIAVGGGRLLRRPLAVCKTEGKDITVCFQIRGEGTKWLASAEAGTNLSVLMPLGNGFYVKETEQKLALVGGGAGIFPMISVVRQYAGKKELSSYIGFRNRAAVCGLEELEKSDRLFAVTDDGSFGEKGNAVQAFARDLGRGYRPDLALACGPLPMLRALKEELKGRKIPCLVSLEERMGCGIGACLVCVCDLTNGEHARVCKDGPVFDLDEIRL